MAVLFGIYGNDVNLTESLNRRLDIDDIDRILEKIFVCSMPVACLS